MSGEVLVWITAPHFTAALILRDDVCIEAAPILAWAKGRRRDWLRDYVARKGWNARAFVTQADGAP